MAASGDVDLAQPNKRPRVESEAVPAQPPSSARPPLLSLLPPLHSDPSGSFKSNLLEADVGITEYIDASRPAFSAIVKHRYTDFLVYEVGRDDQVVRLKDVQRPKLSDEEAAKEAAERAALESRKDEPQNAWPAGADAILSDLLAPKALSALRSLVDSGPPPSMAHGGRGGGGRGRGRGGRGQGRGGRGRGRVEVHPAEGSAPTGDAADEGALPAASGGDLSTSDAAVPSEPAKVSTQPVESKEERTKIHQTIREVFNGRLETELMATPEGADVIEIAWSRNGRAKPRRTAQNDDHPPYIHFTLQKTNRETQDCLSLIGRTLHCHPSKDLGIAGTKDKRSVSVQKVSLRRGRRTVQDVWRAMRDGAVDGGGRGRGRGRGRGGTDRITERGLRGIRIGDLEYADAPLTLGQLNGNRFVITLRDVTPQDSDTLSQAMDTLRSRGFLNYFGMQRFGNSLLGTHMVGLALLRSDWALATNLILRNRPGEVQEIEMARTRWAEGAKGREEAREALDAFPRKAVAERAVLEHFAKNGTNDHLGAVSTIPRNLRMMYGHAYQSYLWNSILSERVRLYDCDRPVLGDLVLVDGDTGVDQEDGVDQSSDAGDGNEQSIGDDEAGVPPSRAKAKAKVITSEADLANYTIHDVVLPIPGYDILYPGNDLANRYEEMMRTDGLDWTNLKRNKAEYSMGGTYRKIIYRPKDLAHRLIRYTSPDHPLARADEDVLLSIPLASEPLPLAEGADSPAEHRSLALQVELTLGMGTYATMALREVLKSESGSAAQKDLTRQMNQRLATATPAVPEASERMEPGPVTGDSAAMDVDG